MSENLSKSHDARKRKTVRLTDEDSNPCVKEANLSKKCLEENLYHRENCGPEYDNYNECKKFWGMVKVKRRAAGILPIMPTKEERDKITDLKKKGLYNSYVS